MATKYLDKDGLEYFYNKIKNNYHFSKKVIDNIPYLFRKTVSELGSSRIGQRCYPVLVGASVAENQLLPQRSSTVTINGVTVTTADTGLITISGTSDKESGYINFFMSGFGVRFAKNHVYAYNVITVQDTGTTPIYEFLFYGKDVVISTNKQGSIQKVTTDVTDNSAFYLRVNYAFNGTFAFYLNVIDLTLLFGSTIADYVYSLETATAGSGIAWLRSYGFLGGYVPYNAGSIESVEVTGKKVVGFNQVDASTAKDNTYINGSGVESAQSEFMCTDFIPCLPSTVYYTNADVNARLYTVIFYDADKNCVDKSSASNATFTTPSNAYYMRANVIKTKMSVSELIINLSSDRNGEYEPYTEQSYDYGTDTLRGIFKLDSNNQLYADGDVKTSDGTVTRKYKKTTIESVSSVGTSSAGVKYAAIGVLANVKLDGYIMSATYQNANNASTDMSIRLIGKTAYVYDNRFTDLATAKNILIGMEILYELATPTTETSTPFQSPQIVYPDGTEEYVTSNGVPVGHETEYTNESILLAGTGLVQNQNTINHINSITAQTTQALYPITIDAQGHISGYGSAVTISTNLVNGSATGSLRSVGSDEESSVYTIGINAFAEGNSTRASGDASHAEGSTTTASNYGSHSEGVTTFSLGSASHSEGLLTTASGDASHAQNYGTKASSDYQTALGKYNIEDTNNTYAVIVGNGTSDSARSNALTVDWNGNIITNGQLINQQGNSIYNNNLNNLVDGSATGSLHSINSDESSSYTIGQYAVALGGDVKASGNFSTALNLGTVSAGNSQTTIGKYNTIDTNNTSAFIVGNGTADDARSNALTVDWNGNVASAGYVQVGGVTQYRDGSIEFTGNVAKAIAPSTTQYKNIVFLDNGGRDSYHRLAFIEHYKTTANENVLQFGVYNHMAGTSSNSWPVGMRFTVNSSQAYFAQIWGNTTVSGSLLTSSGRLYSRLASGEAQIQADNNNTNKIYMYANSGNGSVGIWQNRADGGGGAILQRANNTNVVIFGNGNGNAQIYGWTGSGVPLIAPDLANKRVSYFVGYSSTSIAVHAQFNESTYSTRFISTNTSDARLKKYIKDTDVKALPLINSIQIRQFDWKNGEGHQRIGMIADELEQLDNKLSIGGGYDKDGNINVKSIDTFYLTGYLVKAVQELSTKIEKLEAKLYKYKQ